jgi:hypothetical protein
MTPFIIGAVAYAIYFILSPTERARTAASGRTPGSRQKIARPVAKSEEVRIIRIWQRKIARNTRPHFEYINTRPDMFKEKEIVC